ncbi:hypothetical protein GCM10022222_09870 [Amycolatopsis ultiminotia]|uniref:Secreted protein n=1 Tax=Amycolatopsis ultiminotia TaxID=543629 RepID=A0ABP6V4L9_9PSEU
MAPLLPARIVAIRVAAIFASTGELAGSAAASSAGLANPAGSLTCAITDAGYRWVRGSIHGRPGRMTSPQISISKPDGRSVES